VEFDDFEDDDSSLDLTDGESEGMNDIDASGASVNTGQVDWCVSASPWLTPSAGAIFNAHLRSAPVLYHLHQDARQDMKPSSAGHIIATAGGRWG
jgi:hypothetical protein